MDLLILKVSGIFILFLMILYFFVLSRLIIGECGMLEFSCMFDKFIGIGWFS